ncbi:MAG: PEP-CTERM sorting domain-containing protein [Rhizobiaceae bacterium]
MMNDNIGEKNELKKRLRVWAGVATLAGAGAVVGFLVAIMETDGPTFMARQLDPNTAIWLALATALVLIFGSWFYWRNIDEVERNSNIVGTASGGGTLILCYPPWFLLWKGGLVPEPSHVAMFLIVCVSGALVFLIKQYSRGSLLP